MDLVCEKYQEKIDSEAAVCRRPKEYCKFRSACLIHFRARKKAGDDAGKAAVDKDGGQGVGPDGVGEL